MTHVVSENYKTALLTMVREPCLELKELRRRWPSLNDKLMKERQLLSDNIEEDDPIRLVVDLLSPIGCVSDETIHTRALSYLLDPDPARPHGFGKDVLAALLNKLPRRKGAPKITKLLFGKLTTVTVTAEYRYREEGVRDRSVSRCDVWVELKSRKRAALIIIENKIGAPEGLGQLAWYERKARKWCKEHAPSSSLLLYLTPEKRPPKSSSSGEWLAVSYLELASALRGIWSKAPRAAGRPWLGLYIATITGSMLGIDIKRPKVVDLKTYAGDVFDAK
jgi:hypothetical protein